MKKKNILLGLVFLICVSLAFFVTRILKTNQWEEETTAIIVNDTIQTAEIQEDSIPAEENKPVEEKVAKEEIKEEPTIEPMSTRKFQRHLLNFDDHSILGGHNKQVAKTVIIHFDGGTTDIQGVRDKLKNEIWDSVRVKSLGYDSKGRIKSANITYKEK